MWSPSLFVGVGGSGRMQAVNWMLELLQGTEGNRSCGSQRHAPDKMQVGRAPMQAGAPLQSLSTERTAWGDLGCRGHLMALLY